MTPTSGPGPREVQLELLVGRMVRDADGERVGRLEEVVADVRDGIYVVTEYHLGTGAMLERLLHTMSQIPPFGLLSGRRRALYRVPWERMDLADPKRPRVLGRREDLERIDAARAS